MNVATAAVQLVTSLSENEPANDPVLVVICSSTPPRDPGVFLSWDSSRKPAPALITADELLGNPIPAQSSSLAACDCGVFPLEGRALLPCALEVTSSGLFRASPE